MTIVGVAAPTFRGIDVGEIPSLWIPAVMSAQAIPGFNTMLDRRTRWMQDPRPVEAEHFFWRRLRRDCNPWFKSDVG